METIIMDYIGTMEKNMETIIMGHIGITLTLSPDPHAA